METTNLQKKLPLVYNINMVKVNKIITNKPKFTYITLFSGAGIGCYGFKQNDFNCIATAEILPRRLEIQKYNNICDYDSGYINDDLASETVKEKIYQQIKFWQKNHNVKQVDVVLATPPCQGMSVANHKKKNELSRNSLVVESIKMIHEIKPKIFILENVKSFLNTICTDTDGQNKSIRESIENNLCGGYNILYSVINFKEYGSNSSRPRTLVIGVHKSINELTPQNLMPSRVTPNKLKEIIGHLPSLKNIGDIDEADIYHNFKPYDKKMLEWIKDINQGESAFDNKDKSKIPHQIINNKIVYNQNKNGDKYKRNYWDKPGPCVHTRNDILASQNTIHPKDNRVFSIRELMELMTIPREFRWLNIEEKKLNQFTPEQKRKFLQKEEMNIRQCIGEAVPTTIFSQIAKNITEKLEECLQDNNGVIKIIEENKLYNTNNLYKYIEDNINKLSYPRLSKIAELANAERLKNKAYYTRQDVCFTIINDLPDANSFTSLSILEPSVGVGNFLPLLIDKYQKVKKVTIDVFDIDIDSLRILKLLLKKIKIPNNIKINFINGDFLLHEFNKQYDIVIGNPPFGKLDDKSLMNKYKINSANKKTRNLFAFFIEKSLTLGKNIAMIVPKAILSAPEYNDTKKLIENYKIKKITDYGELGFRGVKIETISMNFETKKIDPNLNKVKIESYITNTIKYEPQSYIIDNRFPYWLIYRNEFFDKIANKLKFNLFTAFRDRKITKKITRSNGKYRVLKSRNIGNNQIIPLKNYDCYINNINTLSVGRFLNHKLAVLVPNLTYKPRATFLPQNSITDGSVAILTPLNGEKITKKDLDYYNSEEYNKFYRLARNLGTRSLNIDRNSVFFFGKIS